MSIKLFFGFPMSYKDFSDLFNDGKISFELNTIHQKLASLIPDNEYISLVHIGEDEDKQNQEFLIGHFTELENKPFQRLRKSRTKELIEFLGLDPSDCDTYLVNTEIAENV